MLGSGWAEGLIVTFKSLKEKKLFHVNKISKFLGYRFV